MQVRITSNLMAAWEWYGDGDGSQQSPIFAFTRRRSCDTMQGHWSGPDDRKADMLVNFTSGVFKSEKEMETDMGDLAMQLTAYRGVVIEDFDWNS